MRRLQVSGRRPSFSTCDGSPRPISSRAQTPLDQLGINACVFFWVSFPGTLLAVLKENGKRHESSPSSGSLSGPVLWRSPGGEGAWPSGSSPFSWSNLGSRWAGVRYAGSSYDEPILYLNSPSRKDVCLTFAVSFFVRFNISVANSGPTPPDKIQ